MKAKDVRLSFRLNNKTALYLNKLGIIDLRTGRIRKDSKINISEFMNNSIVTILESNKSPYSASMSAPDLKLAWSKYRIKLLQDEIMKIQKDLTEE